MTKKIIFIFLLGLSALQLTAQPEGFRVVGYIPSYRWGVVNTVDYTKLTHINVAFVNPTDDEGTIGFGQDLTTLVNNAHTHDVKVLASIGGAGANATRYGLLLQDENRSDFVDSLVKFLHDHDLDGIDVDLEGPTLDIPEYGVFVADLADTLHKEGMLLTAALAQWDGWKVPDAALDSFDFINLMAYDVTGPWDADNPGQHSPYGKATEDISYWKNTRGVPQDKVVLGVPFYGYQFSGGSVSAWTFGQVVATYPGAEWVDQWGNIYYNGIPTIQNKTALAMGQAKGIMIWELGQDASGDLSLLNAIDARLNGVIIARVNDDYHDENTRLYPNPAGGNTLTIESQQPITGYAIRDYLGRVCAERTVQPASSVHPDISGLAPGSYLLHIYQGERLVIKQFKKF